MLNFLLSLHGMRNKKEKMNQELADIIALRALAFIAGDDNYLNLLMMETGLSQNELIKKSEDNLFLAGILDFILGHEKILINFCEDCGLDYTIPALARQLYFTQKVDII